jgi:hypothetical protein
MIFNNSNKNIIVQESQSLYKWASIFNRLQRDFFVEDVKLRREKQIEDFVYLNEFENLKLITDTDVFQKLKLTKNIVDDAQSADLVILTDQKFSRYPCPEIINQIEKLMTNTKHLYLCLNRHYINIDNSYHDRTLSDNLNLAVTQWLKKSLLSYNIVDLSIDYLDVGHAFTWALPDRHYYITHK